MPTSPAAGQPAPSPAFDWIVRHRRIFFAVIAVIMLLSFNGQWRVGPDSAAYRGLAHHLATTGGYTFRDRLLPGTYGDQAGTRYPGLPVLLALIERVFGTGSLAPLAVMWVLAGVTLLLIYRLMRYHLPQWLAVFVVVGVGMNNRFLEYANELLTDVPFLLGLVMTLLGYEQFLRARGARQMTLSGALTLCGCLSAAMMRPTFWVLALALGVACVWGVASAAATRRQVDSEENAAAAPPVRPGRVRYAMLLAMMALAAIVFLVALDYRSKRGILSGGYERKLFSQISEIFTQPDAGAKLRDNVGRMLDDSLPMAFLGTLLGNGFIPFGKYPLGLGALFSLVLIIASVALIRRSRLWALLVLAEVLTLAVVGPVARYFVMILPLLLAGWGLLIERASRRLPGPLWSSVAVGLGLGIVLLLNFFPCVDLVLTQRGIQRPFGPKAKWVGFKYVGFLNTYQSGKWSGIYDLAKMTHDATTARQKVIGPEATILTFLSDRQVYAIGQFVPPRQRGGEWIHTFQRQGIGLILLPIDDPTPKFREHDKMLRDLQRSGVLKTGATIAQAGGYRLAKFELSAVSRVHHHRDRPVTAPTTRRVRTTLPATTSNIPK